MHYKTDENWESRCQLANQGLRRKLLWKHFAWARGWNACIPYSANSHRTLRTGDKLPIIRNAVSVESKTNAMRLQWPVSNRLIGSEYHKTHGHINCSRFSRVRFSSVTVFMFHTSLTVRQTQFSYVGSRPHFAHIQLLPSQHFGWYQITLLRDVPRIISWCWNCEELNL